MLIVTDICISGWKANANLFFFTERTPRPQIIFLCSSSSFKNAFQNQEMSHSHMFQVCSMSQPSSLYCDGSTEWRVLRNQELLQHCERGPSPWKLTTLTDLNGAGVWMRSPGTWVTGHPEFRSSSGVAVPELSSVPLEVNALECGNAWESWVQEWFSVCEYKYLLIYNTVRCVHSKWMKKRHDILHWKHPTHTQKCRLGLHTNYK